MTDWKALCEELTEYLALLDEPPHELVCRAQERLAQSEPEDDVAILRAALKATAAQRRAEDDARAALAQPEPEVRELSDQELDDLADATPWHGSPRRFGREVARAAIAADRARWGRPAPAPAGEVAELVASLRDAAASNERIGATQAAVQLTRAADLLEHLASPACPVLDPSPEVIAALKAAGPGRIIEPLPEDAQVIEPTEHTILVPARTPVPVSERPWEREGWCDEQGRCWMGRWRIGSDPGPCLAPNWALQRADTASCLYTHALPFHALPLPAGEVEA